MYSPLKKFQAITLALLVLLSPLLITAQDPPKPQKHFIEYGLEPDRIPSRFKPKTSVPRRMSVPQLRRSLEIFRRAGGIMFDEVSKPCGGLTNVRLRLSYNSDEPDGQRLILHAGAHAYSVDGVYDSDLRAIAMFASSPVPVLTNVLTPDPSLLASCPLPPYKLQIVALHQALIDTQLGWNLTRMDSIPWSFSRGKRWDKEDEPLPDETLPLANLLSDSLRRDYANYLKLKPQVRAGLFDHGVSTVKAIGLKERKEYDSRIANLTEKDLTRFEAQFQSVPGFAAKWEQLDADQKYIVVSMISSVESKRISNFNDDNARPSFCTDASTVKLDGLPNLQFITPQHPGNFVFPESSSLMTQHLDQLRPVDPEAYDGLITTYRLAGLFRYVKKQQTPLAWKRFIKSLPAPQTKSTYVILCPECEKDALEKWWTCAEKIFVPKQTE